MIFSTHNGQSFWLIDDAQDASDAFETTVSIIRDSSAGLTNRETRRPFSTIFRWRCKYQLTLEGRARITFEAALADDPAARYAVPLWPLAIQAADFATANFTAGVWLAIDPTRNGFLIFSGAPPPPPALSEESIIMPLALGTIARRQTEAIGPNHARAVIDFTENSPAAWAISPKTFPMTDGPLPPNYPAAPKLCDFIIDYENLAEDWTFKAYAEQIGFGRETQRETYPQTPAREYRGEFVLSTLEEIARFLSFVAAHFAGQSFWAPAWKLAALIDGPIAAGQIAFNGPNALKPGDAIAFVTTSTIDARTVVQSSPAGFNINTPVGPYDADQFGVHELKLVRIRTTEQNINWLGNEVARAMLDFREVPAEYTIPSDETLAETIGALPLRAFLYTFETRIAGTVTTARFTSFETDLTVAGEGTFTAAKIQHDEITQSLDLDANEAQLTLAIFPGNPLVPVATVEQYGIVGVTIRQATVTGTTAENLETLFLGDVTEVKTNGSTLTATAASGGEAFDRPLPRFTIQPTCNYPLFSAGCTLDRNNWTFQCFMDDPGAPGFPHAFNIRGLQGLNGYPADFFAGGFLELGKGLGSGPVYQILPIIRSTAIGPGGTSTITLTRDPRPFPIAGELIACIPGCDAQQQTCIHKFFNYLNFGGHPYVPKQNSSITRPDAAPDTGKK